MDIIENEIWKSVPNYQGIKVSSLGRVEKAPNVTRGNRILDKFKADKDRYFKTTVKKLDGSYTCQFVHRLVAMAFIPNPDNKPCVNHINGNRQDNRVSNLEWVSYRENVMHSYQYGARKKCKDVPRNSKLTDYQIEQISFLRNHYSLKELSKLFNISYQSMKNISIKILRDKRLDNQQPSKYKSIYSIID